LINPHDAHRVAVVSKSSNIRESLANALPSNVVIVGVWPPSPAFMALLMDAAPSVVIFDTGACSHWQQIHALERMLRASPNPVKCVAINPPLSDSASPLPYSSVTNEQALADWLSNSIIQQNKHAKQVLILGASTGGPEVIQTFLEQCPPELDTPILLVQHLLPTFVPSFTTQLNQIGARHFEVVPGLSQLRKQSAWISPGDQHMILTDVSGTIYVQTTQTARVHNLRPALDTTLLSAANIPDLDVVAVVFSGFGKDGFKGAEAIKKAGGSVYVQDQGSSAAWGMPGAIAKAGLMDAVLPPKRLAQAVIQRLTRGD